MTRDDAVFIVDSPAAGRGALDGIADAHPVRRNPAADVRRTYHDTFDGRVYRNQGSVVTVRAQGDTELSWVSHNGRRGGFARVRRVPAFAAELPPGVLRDELGPLIGVRRLLPLVEVRAKEETLDVLDDLGKTVARVVLQEGRATAPRSPAWSPRAQRHDLPLLLHVQSIRGYEAVHRRLVAELSARPGLTPLEADELSLALAPIGLAPGQDPCRPSVALRPGLRADAAAKAIHRDLLAILRRNEAGVRLDLDTEFLHDFRVAVRRTRAALGQIPEVFPAAVTKRFTAEFSWLGKVTGPTRDLDVHLLRWNADLARIESPVREDLAPLRSFLSEQRDIEQAKLVRALDSDRYGRLVEGWARFLSEPVPEVPDVANAGRSVVAVASERIWRSYRRVTKRARHVRGDVEAMHSLRIQCKKLRYLLDAFATLYGVDRVTGLVRRLKRLQDVLGDVNDCTVQQTALRTFGQRMHAAGRASPECLVALGRLVERLELRKLDKARRFQKRFERFATPEVRSEFARLFGPNTRQGSP